MVVCSGSFARVSIVREQLEKRGIESTHFSVQGEPTTETALVGVEKARQAACDCVIGIDNQTRFGYRMIVVSV
jgi:alcohol dehydrogenase class IV